ncbi:pyruvate ferredoxin oxidoreductase subunit gamma [Candidatus Woesearchaeota archaeon]|nr:pyruvate ferredoxin oxidoreductase subunit gamma [Candidatus Woesearchaeota archaeon]MBW3016831.1 pyruvate ferredoxin oxidoreductase subunit gamma [Candidatus Woesearchaeota archaeon]
MIEIRVHGRGGQGAVTTSQLIAIAGFLDGKQTQGFPNFGVERRGAPSNAFVRIDDNPINIRSQVYCPDVVLVLDASLVQALDVTEGVKENGIIIINSKKKPEELGLKNNFKVYAVDATQAAMDIMGKAIVNTAILGAFAKVTGLVSIESLHKAIEQRFKGELANKNKQIIQKLYEAVEK